MSVKKKREEVKLEEATKRQEILDLEVTEEQVVGEVVGFGEPVEVDTRFGKAYRFPINVKVNGSVTPISIFVRDKTLLKKTLHPRSNLYKLLTAYKCERLRQLVGKRVTLRIDEKGFYRIVF